MLLINREEVPTIVCLCGSTRFEDEFLEAQKTETLAGRIVLTVGLFGHRENLDMGGPTKRMLDELHLRKIDLADEVFVINPICRRCPECNAVWRYLRGSAEACLCTAIPTEPRPYVGESTKREIAYAKEKGKKIRYLVET